MEALVFGARGALGSAIVDRLTQNGFAVHTPPHSIALDAIADLPKLDAVAWAQGLNASDSLLCFNEADFAAVMEANVAFVARTLARLLDLDRLASPARLCVISSIWQEQARTEKFSVDTPMSRAHLSAAQIASISSACPLGRLPTPEDVAAAVAFLVGSDNRSITGQSLTVDGGFSAVRRL